MLQAPPFGIPAKETEGTERPVFDHFFSIFEERSKEKKSEFSPFFFSFFSEETKKRANNIATAVDRGAPLK